MKLETRIRFFVVNDNISIIPRLTQYDNTDALYKYSIYSIQLLFVYNYRALTMLLIANRKVV